MISQRKANVAKADFFFRFVSGVVPEVNFGESFMSL
jgi:hypothetical protein